MKNENYEVELHLLNIYPADALKFPIGKGDSEKVLEKQSALH